ncbi:Ribosomal RNA processing protein 36 -like protein [Toxocara canis]|uniref:rRNA biogenesis protein RRP36 n=1 Tax=Toxocara canis TaxID=6265 RepID=A0A0B2VK70_TOXCA|nr:Ribosomal RNA processing protein 36 -like protein [Toxocara canis]
MEHELNGVKRTFPKKKTAGNGETDNFTPKHKRTRIVNRRAPPTKGSKARRRARSAKFEAKIAAKKAATAEALAKEAADQLTQHCSTEPDQEVGNERIELGNMKAEGSTSQTTRGMNMHGDEEDGSDVEEDIEENVADEWGGDKGRGMVSESELDDNDAFRREISNMPMSKVKQLKEKLGIKLFNKAFFGKSTVQEASQKEIAKLKNRSFTRDNAKRPREMSSKRPVSKFRNVYANERIEKKRFDPRFDERCGPFDEYIHRTNYAFLEELRQNEKKLLVKEIQKAKQEDPEAAERMKETLRRITNREKSLAERERSKEVLRELRRENNERMRQGKKPIFLRRAEVKMRIMEKKFEELKKTNKLDDYLQRKAKKQNSKDARPV